LRLRVTVQLQSPVLQRPELLRESLERVVSETAFEVEADIKEQMRAPKSGRTYARGAITRRSSKTTRGLGLRERTTKGGNRLAIVGSALHRASAPGEAPAIDLGELVNSYTVQLDGLRASVGSPKELAALLEGGTGKIAPRPAAEPAAERAQEPFTRRVNEAVAQLI
jgi:hypothetical protein